MSNTFAVLFEIVFDGVFLFIIKKLKETKTKEIIIQNYYKHFKINEKIELLKKSA